MTDTNSEERENEFECSECDYKCISEHTMMEHSTIHNYPSPTADNSLSYIYDCSKAIRDAIESNDNYNSEGGFKRETSHLIYKDNSFGASGHFLKRESNSHKGIYSDNVNHESEVSIEMIKSEQIDIKHEIIQNTKDDFTEEEISSLRKKDEIIYLSNESSQSKNHSWAPRSSHVSDLFKMERFIDINIDNSGIYIPPGWKRQVFMGSKLWRTYKIVFNCIYFTDTGMAIRNNKETLEYLKHNQSTNIEIKRLDFSLQQVSKALMHLDQRLLEFDVVDKNIYVPDEWKRKLKVKISSDLQLFYNIFYISPNGIIFWSASELISYISNDDNNVCIDIAKLDFRFGRRNTRTLRAEELFASYHPAGTISVNQH